MKKIWSIILIFILSLECKKIFLESEILTSLDYPDSKNNLVIFYDKHFTVTDDGHLFVKTHRVLKGGSDLKTFPELLYVFDGSVEKLVDFRAQLIHHKGSSKTYSKRDLLVQNLSGRQVISQLKVRFLPITDTIAQGDLLETIAIHQFTLPPLGIRFSLSEIGINAKHISCSIEVPLSDSLRFKIVNDSLAPTILFSHKSKNYRFDWQYYSPQSSNLVFEKRNRAPEILASIPRFKASNSSDIKSITNWIEFGNWYLELIGSKMNVSQEMMTLAQEIVAGTNTEKEKMDAIFEYCQKNIRYEQVYLEKGEFIPNDCSVILARKYGDCKDYATLLHALARSLGLNSHLALCHRGRGFEFQKETPVNQFNHLIVHFSDGETNYWYDGTNRTGIPGITTMDLMNETALVLEQDHSRLLRIAESSENILRIEGYLNCKDNGLVGQLNINLAAQYAIDFFYRELFLNKVEMQNFLIDWIKENINRDIIIQAIGYQKKQHHFVISVKCELPNSILVTNPYCYVNLARVFSDLVREVNVEDHIDQVFYFPYYNRVAITLNISNLCAPGKVFNSLEPQGYNWIYSYIIPPGPFYETQKSEFIQTYKSTIEELKNTVKLIRKEIL